VCSGGDGGGGVGRRGEKRSGERKARRREAYGANDDVIVDVITWDAHTAATGGSMDPV